MNVDTGAFTKLTAEVERMAAKVDRLGEITDSLASTEILLRVSYEQGRCDERAAILGGSEARRTRQTSRLDRSRPGHLRLAGDGGPR